MKVLIKQVKIVCSSSPSHGKVQDILIEDGKIKQISANITSTDATEISHNGLCVSIGWMDIFAGFADPGYEHRESLATGATAAAAGGYTDVMVMPNTNPVISSKTQVEYVVQKAVNLPVNIYPIAAITKNAEGKELAEMYDMFQSGAVAFSDGTQSLQSPGILLKALQYVLSIDATIIQIPNDKTISAHGLVNEGIVSTQLGLPGQPAIAEELMIARDIELLRYTNSKLHITGVSTKKGLELIAAAKKEGLQLTYSVTPYHAYFCDEDLTTYNTNLKTDPPLRRREDMLAIREAIRNGDVDCIASHHIPHHWDDKECEFEYAKKGMTGLESVFGVVNNYGADLIQLIDSMTITPRTIFDVPMPTIAEGAAACLTLFAPDEKYIFQETMIRSKSKNNPFTGKELKGKVVGIINKNKLVLNQS